MEIDAILPNLACVEEMLNETIIRVYLAQPLPIINFIDND